MNRFIILTICLLCPIACFAGSGYNLSGGALSGEGVAAGGGSCSSGTLTGGVDLAVEGSNTTQITNIARGQSFAITASGSQYLYSVSVYVVSMGGTPVENVELRVGTSSDLTTYSLSKTQTIPNGDGVWREFVFDSPLTFEVNNSTTYYWGIYGPASSGIYFRRNAGNPYAGGTFIYASSGWNMSTTDATSDEVMQVKLCQ